MEQLSSSPRGLALKDKKEQLDIALKGSECGKLFVMERENIWSSCINSTARKGKKRWVLTENDG